MITTPDGYKYTNVAGVDVRGAIVPALDWTGAVSVERMEDISYLTEMTRERTVWADPVKWTPPLLDVPVPSYDASNRVVEIGTIRDIYRSIHDMRTVGSGVYSGAINKDLDVSSLGLPVIVSAEDGYAIDELFSRPEFAVAVKSQLPARPLVTDDLRRMYMDLASMTRFVLSIRESRVTGETFSSMVEWMAYTEGGRENWKAVHCEGPLVAGDGNSILYERGSGRTSVPGFIYPYYTRAWGEDGSISYEAYTEHESCVVVNKGVCFDESSRRVLPERVVAYTNWSIIAEMRSEDGTHVRKSATGVFPVYLDYAGGVDGTWFDGMADAFYTVSVDMAPIFETARRWVAENYPDFASRPAELSVQLGGVYIDSGVLQLNSSIPDTWTWSPS